MLFLDAKIFNLPINRHLEMAPSLHYSYLEETCVEPLLQGCNLLPLQIDQEISKIDMESMQYFKNLTLIRHINPYIGYGLFSDATVIPPGIIIGEFTGVIERYAPHNYFYSFKYPKMPNDLDLIINTETKSNEFRFMNHSSHPNCAVIIGLLPRSLYAIAYIKTLVEIQSGEQLTINYGEKYWKYMSFNPQSLI